MLEEGELANLLQVETLQPDLFRGHSPHDSNQRVFGGQVAAQALLAAARTVAAGGVHSLHAYFLRSGDPTPILYRVQRIRDGRSFAVRRVDATQHGETIFNLMASFHDNADEQGFDHQDRLRAAAPPPESLPTFPARLAEWGIDAVPRPLPPERRVWFRAYGPLPNDPVVHACVVTYASDLYLLGTALLPHGIPSTSPDVVFASLDHAMWFHRPFRGDEWLLHVQRTPSASDGRGLATGSIYRQDGTLVATVVQEGVLRRRR
jgi:acyl-CoA thioesterase II